MALYREAAIGRLDEVLAPEPADLVGEAELALVRFLDEAALRALLPQLRLRQRDVLYHRRAIHDVERLRLKGQRLAVARDYRREAVALGAGADQRLMDVRDIHTLCV